jgi:hypothetical protein
MSAPEVVAAPPKFRKANLVLTAPSTTTPVRSQLTLLTLPTEIRLMIYHILFHYPRGTLYLVRGMKVGKSAQLLAVCRQVYMEAKEVLDRDKDFWMLCKCIVRKSLTC